MSILAWIISAAQIIKEKTEPSIPADSWDNKELYYQDMLNGVSNKQLQKNVENGKYRLEPIYGEPHRDEKGKIVIENCKLYEEDKFNYGWEKAQQWAKQGKYNLTPEELEKEHERIREKLKRLYNL